MDIASPITVDGTHLIHRDLFNENNLVFRSTDLEEVRAHVSRVFKPHMLGVTSGSREFHGLMHHTRRGDVSLNLLDYGGDVTIEPDRLETFFLIQIPMHGCAEIECGNERFVSSPRIAALLSPSLPLRMRWGPACPQVCLRIEREYIQQHCERHLGGLINRPVEFAPALHLDRSAGAYFMHLIHILAESMSVPDHPLRNELAYAQFVSTLINALTYGQPNNLQENLRKSAGTIAPFFIKRAEEYIRANLHEPLTAERLAEHAGVSVRTMFSGFQKFCGMSPMAYVRCLRLERVREELISANGADTSITTVATKWGFGHLGRFSIDYKRQFGESPSVSVKKGNRIR